jgi:hypothetical protein
MPKIIVILACFFLCSCSPKIATSVQFNYASLNDQDNVLVYSKEESLPENAKIIGKTSIGDSGFTTNCDYDVMLEKAKNEARKKGANAIKITEHILPNYFGSSCHRIKAQMLKIESSDKEISIDKPLLLVSDTIHNTPDKNLLSDNGLELIRKSRKATNFLILSTIGQSFRVADSPKGLNTEQNTYLKKLKSGLSYDFSAYYLNDNQAGIGIKYNVYKSNGLLQNQVVTFKDGSEGVGSISDAITISFIGPSIIIYNNENSKLGEANLELALGYMSYENQARVLNQRFSVKGADLGIIGGMGYYFRLSPHFLIGPQVNFVGGVLRKLKITYSDGSIENVKLEKEKFENLWRIDLTIGAQFRF